MKSIVALLLFCFSLSVATAQTTPKKKATTTKKPVTTAQKASTTKKATTTAAKKPVVTKPRATTVAPVVTEAAASTLTFPSTEPENAATLDAVKKQQMYDELHGIKPQSTVPNTGRKGRTRDSDEMATRADRRAEKASSGEAGTYIGVRLGGNYTAFLERQQVADGLGGFLDITPDPIYGFHAGVVFQFGRGGVAFQPEINFHQDYRTVITRTATTITTTTEPVNSIVVPLLAKFQFGQQGATRFFVNVGPYGAYSLDAGNSESVIAYGGALGLGLGIPAGSGKFTVEARGYYTLGDTKNSFDFGNPPGKPFLGQLSVGYLFPLGSR
ncbi:outer membrane beta-barrel protein [Fibrella aquatica]|uniref:outer membrane beta-barrel protein n=1 Tax=Fibrella aquatica TaxID=3242487 RepID=UPI0035228321